MANSDNKNMKRESKYKAVAVTVTPFIIVGGICISFGWKYVNRVLYNRRPKQNILPRSMFFAAIHGGKLALERLVDYQNSKGNATETTDDIKELETLLGKEQPPFKDLQRIVARVEMSGREDEAIKILKKALTKAQKEGKSHEAYEIEMVLVEMYIYKGFLLGTFCGDVQNAIKCKCLAEEEPSDSRRALFKAMVSMIEQREEDGLEHWKKFKEIQQLTIQPNFHDEEFNEFKNAVNLLKKDIDAANQLKKR